MNGRCECGCGEKTPLSKQTDPRFGLIKGQPCRFLLGHQTKIGPKHPGWKGDNCKQHTGRARAIKKFSIDLCEKCLKKAIDRHHKDENTKNNDRSNLLFLCRRCHMILDGRLAKLIKRNQRRISK